MILVTGATGNIAVELVRNRSVREFSLNLIPANHHLHTSTR